MSFSGSYAPADVRFLLTRLALTDFVDVNAKETLIQSGARHYSELLTIEQLPSARYLDLFDAACRANGARMARDCLRLARLIAARRTGPITLVSLARGGTPVGVIVKRLLERACQRAVTHYSVSIVRDRGIDANALRHILDQQHDPASLVFIDGWTGKGVIAAELASTIGHFNAAHGVALDPGLHVLSDLAGAASVAASCDDYLIPSSILNATVSGLVSRSVLTAALGEHDFHGCVLYDQFASEDRSRSFVDLIEGLALAQLDAAAPGMELDAAPGAAAGAASGAAAAAARSRAYLAQARERYGIADVNLVKPGIGEATRVLLRRLPRRLLLRDGEAAATAHLRMLAEQKNVPVEVDPALPYQAVSLIRSASDA